VLAGLVVGYVLVGEVEESMDRSVFIWLKVACPRACEAEEVGVEPEVLAWIVPKLFEPNALEQVGEIVPWLAAVA